MDGSRRPRRPRESRTESKGRRAGDTWYVGACVTEDEAGSSACVVGVDGCVSVCVCVCVCVRACFSGWHQGRGEGRSRASQEAGHLEAEERENR